VLYFGRFTIYGKHFYLDLGSIDLSILAGLLGLIFKGFLGRFTGVLSVVLHTDARIFIVSLIGQQG
jgi:hypothetical protein